MDWESPLLFGRTLNCMLCGYTLVEAFNTSIFSLTYIDIALLRSMKIIDVIIKGIVFVLTLFATKQIYQKNCL